MQNFWEKLRKPIYALAPMAGFTDSAFRRMCKGYGADVVYSEMASATALVYAPAKTLEMLYFTEEERPYVVQLFGSKHEHFAAAARLLSKKGIPRAESGILSSRSASWRRAGLQNDRCLIPDGIDINFGCPVKKVAKQGAGAVLMNDPAKAREIVKSVIGNTDLPVSVKVRSKAGKIDVLRFLDGIGDLDIKTVMIHGRTLAQGFSGEADAAVIRKARDHFPGLILANGGVGSHDDAARLLEESRADGIGVARGALGRPWIFKAARTGQSVERERKAVFKEARRHARLVWELKGGRGIVEMRAHLCYYVSGLAGAGELRRALVCVENLKDVERILKE